MTEFLDLNYVEILVVVVYSRSARSFHWGKRVKSMQGISGLFLTIARECTIFSS